MPVKDLVASYLHGEPLLKGNQGCQFALTKHGGQFVAQPRASGAYFLPDLSPPEVAWMQGRTRGPEQITFEIGPDGLVVKVTIRGLPKAEVIQLGLAVTDFAGRDRWVGGGTWLELPERQADAEAPPLRRALGTLIAGAPVPWSTAPSEDAASPAPRPELPPDATVDAIASRITELSGLSDGELARVFSGQVRRETYQRWRTGELTNPTPGNRRRLGLLLRLFEDLAHRRVRIADWLRNCSTIEGRSPYDLLELGRIDDVEYLAAQVPARGETELVVSDEGRIVELQRLRPAFSRRSVEPSYDLQFEDDDAGWIEVDGTGDDDE